MYYVPLVAKFAEFSKQIFWFPPSIHSQRRHSFVKLPKSPTQRTLRMALILLIGLDDSDSHITHSRCIFTESKRSTIYNLLISKLMPLFKSCLTSFHRFTVKSDKRINFCKLKNKNVSYNEKQRNWQQIRLIFGNSDFHFGFRS